MTSRENRIAWIISGILFALLLIVGYLYYATREDLATVLENGKQDIAAEKAQIAKDCRGPEVDRNKCSADLADLSAVLADFSANLREASSSYTASTTLLSGQNSP